MSRPGTGSGPVVFWPFPTYPHLGPTLGVAQELVRRGRRVVYAAPEQFRGAVTAAGAELLPYRIAPEPLEPGSSDPVDLAFGYYLAVLSGAGELADVLAADRPAALVHDTHLWGTAAGLARRLGARAVQSFPTFASNEHFSLRRAEAVTSGGVEHPSVAVFWRRVVELADALGFGGFDRDGFLAGHSDANVVFLPREFQIDGDTFDDRFAFVGPCPGSGPLEGRWNPPVDGPGRVALVSLGTSPFGRDADFFRSCVRALADSGHHLVLTVGDTADDGIGPLPGSVEVHRWLRHPAVLRHADVFVTQGGIGSMMEALTHGVPLVLSPRNGEQEVNAARAAELGLGRLLPVDLHPDTLRDAVAAAYCPDVRARVDAMRDAVRAAGGARAAADAIV